MVLSNMFIQINENIIVNTKWITNIYKDYKTGKWYVEFIRYLYGEGKDGLVCKWCNESVQLDKTNVEEILGKKVA